MNSSERTERRRHRAVSPIGALAGGALTLLLAGSAYAGVQASGSNSIFPSDSTLMINQQITLEVTVSNTSSNTPPPNSNTVPATLTGTTTVKLACVDSGCVSELPGTLTFVSCTPDDPGVASCTSVDSNTVAITMTAGGVTLTAGELFHDLATITVTATTPVTGGNGDFFTRAATGNTDFSACQQPEGTPCATGAGQGSAVLSFPPVCGDGIVNESFQTCDALTLPGPPDECCPGGAGLPCGPTGQQIGCPAADANGNDCRAANATDPCTICGDGIVQTTSGEACDDGNSNNDDDCTNACETT